MPLEGARASGERRGSCAFHTTLAKRAKSELLEQGNHLNVPDVQNYWHPALSTSLHTLRLEFSELKKLESDI